MASTTTSDDDAEALEAQRVEYECQICNCKFPERHQAEDHSIRDHTFDDLLAVVVTPETGVSRE